MTTEDPPDDVTKEQLWNRLRRLEQAVFPDRRAVLKSAAGVAALGAAGAGGYTTGQARAADTSVGSVGTTSDAVDVYLDQIRDPNDNVIMDVDSGGSALSIDVARLASANGDEVEEIVDYAEDMDGSTATDLTLSVSNLAECRVVIAAADGSTSGTVVKMQVNGESSTSYQQTEYASGALSDPTGNSEWVIAELEAGRGLKTELELYDGSIGGVPQISASTVDVHGTRVTERKMVSGVIDTGGLGAISAIRVFSTTDSMIKAYVKDATSPLS